MNRVKSIFLLLLLGCGVFAVAGDVPGDSAPQPDLKLIGIAIFQGRSTALIANNVDGAERFYEEGDALDSFVVKKIESDRVVLSRDGAEVFLPLFPEPATTSIEEESESEPLLTPPPQTKRAKDLKTAVKPSSKTSFLMPVSGYIGSGFGYRISPMGGERQFHRGIDIVAPYGRSVRAVADGIVTFANRRWGLGKTIMIQHSNGWQSVYGHLSKLLVSSGEKVEAGQTIGAIGSTGNSTGPHLHFELHKSGRPVNPATYLPLGK